MIAAVNIVKRFGEQTLFENATFSVNDRERVGLVGRNGHGKSTLFRILTGEEQLDGGALQVPRNYTIGYLRQEYRFTEPTVSAEACLGLPVDRREEYWVAEKILAGLGFSDEDMERPPSEFSGGYQIRINLAKTLLSEPDLLLLDEPTNFLDVVSVRWLENHLNAWKGDMIVISHDRSFMDRVTTHIMGIHRRRIRKIQGKTHDFYAQIEMEEEVHEKQRVNQEKKNRQTERFIARFRAKARLANMVQSRVKALARQVQLAKLDTIPTLSFDFRYAPHESKYLMDARALTFSYTGKSPYLINNFDLIIEPDDRIGIIGKNGRGKTTLLKMMAGVLNPLSGRVVNSPGAKLGYFEQANTALLRPDMTVEEEIMSAMPEPARGKARDICGAMMFTGDAALKRISVLSGGEKCRVLIGQLLVQPSNLLLLDEPTHHLDMEATESLMGALDEFEGACAIVTHNERILETVVTKLVVFQGGGVFVFDGPYDQFLEEVGWEEVQGRGPSQHQQQAKPAEAALPAQNRKEDRKSRADFVQRRSAVLNPLKKRIDALEKEIALLEKSNDADLKTLLSAAEKQDIPLMIELNRKTELAKQQMETDLEELITVTEEYDKQKAAFEEP